jgi:hypothetical protein
MRAAGASGKRKAERDGKKTKRAHRELDVWRERTIRSPAQTPKRF